MARAQLKLGSNPAVINKSSILELESARQGLLLPRIPDTTVATLATAPDGMIIYFTSDNSLRIRKNGYWMRLADAGNFWQNAGSAGGDLTGSYPSPSIAAGAVTFSKMQSINTGRLLGRYAAGSGTVQEITLGTGLSLNSTTGELTAATGWLLGGNSVASTEEDLGTINNRDLPIITNNAERMRIKSDGLIGINTTSPTAQLHIRTASAGASGLRLENLTASDPVTTTARAIGVDPNGNVVKAPVPVYYSGNGTSATIGAITKIWVADTANTATGIVEFSIPANVAFTSILNIQVTAKGGTSVTTAPIAVVTSNTLTAVTIRVLESGAALIIGQGLEVHGDTNTRIYIRVEGN
jgi:hypothetical protein